MLVIETMTPSGVEQKLREAIRARVRAVIETMTPSGVEQAVPSVAKKEGSQVIETMTPSGVEQWARKSDTPSACPRDRDDDAFGR